MLRSGRSSPHTSCRLLSARETYRPKACSKRSSVVSESQPARAHGSCGAPERRGKPGDRPRGAPADPRRSGERAPPARVRSHLRRRTREDRAGRSPPPARDAARERAGATFDRLEAEVGLQVVEAVIPGPVEACCGLEGEVASVEVAEELEQHHDLRAVRSSESCVFVRLLLAALVDVREVAGGFQLEADQWQGGGPGGDHAAPWAGLP